MERRDCCACAAAAIIPSPRIGSSSAVYGMPGAAAELRAASEILALDKIGPRLTNIVAQRMKAHG